VRQSDISFADAFGGSGAIFHPGINGPKTYRLLLWRCFARESGGSLPMLGVCMKNPSVAGEQEDDATVRVLLRIAHEAGAGGIIVGNIIPYVATEPRDMLRAYRARNANLEMHREWHTMWGAAAHEMWRLRAHCPRVLVAWGNLERDLREVAATVQLSLSRPHYAGEVLMLGRNRDGSPHHPLRIRLGRPLEPWWPRTNGDGHACE
jgi:hypothetical protein